MWFCKLVSESFTMAQSTKSRHLFAGHQVRALRRKLGISQGAMAAALSVSVSYLSQIESGDRPLSSTVLTALARCYPADWGTIETDVAAELLIGVSEASADPSIPDALPDRRETERLIRQQPLAARRLLSLYRAYRRSLEQLRILDESVDAGGARLPWEAVRDWFHLQHNYVDAIDRRAESIAIDLIGDGPREKLERRLTNRFGVRVEPLEAESTAMREFNPASRVLKVNVGQASETNLFSLAYLLARLEFGDLLGVIAEAGMPTDDGRRLLAAGLANYAAGALLMPYTAFRDAARACRHDVDRLRQPFGTSFEQTCHRLSTLQRPGSLGVPVFFCRVDMAGNITKRHSATPLQFARFGGACPLWIVHEAVAIPDRILVQLAETPDGVRYLSMAKGLVKSSGSYRRTARRYAIALGWEERHASEFVYADGVGGVDTLAVPIGTSCRICPRVTCEQRAFPPAASRIEIDHDRRGSIPYDVRL